MYIGLDIGGTNTRIVTSESLDHIKFVHDIVIPTSENYKNSEQEIVVAIKQLECTVSGIGIGLPGSINDLEQLDGSTNLPDWVGQPLKNTFEREFGCAVKLKNDAEIGALGEAYYGVGNTNDFLYLTWGTGLGVAQIHWRDGVPVVSRPADRQSIYDLETSVGGKDIERRFSVDPKDLSDGQWNQVVADLFQHIPALTNEYGFADVVIGGGIAVRKKDLLESAAKEIRDIKVFVTNLDGKAGLYGALGLCKE